MARPLGSGLNDGFQTSLKRWTYDLSALSIACGSRQLWVVLCQSSLRRVLVKSNANGGENGCN